MTSTLWTSDPFILSCCHSGRSPSHQRILLKQLFVDSQSKIKRKKKEEEEPGGIVMLLSTAAACNDYAFVRSFLWIALIGKFILPLTISKPEEQSPFLLWITDACTISEMKSLATERLSFPYFTHLAYLRVCFESLTPPASWGGGSQRLYNCIIINCFVVLGGGHCIFSSICSILFFSQWFPWVIMG